MHEVGIAQGILEMALKAATEAGGSRIETLRVRVGVLTGVVPDALLFALETLRVGTTAQDARVELEVEPARAWCSRCESAFEVRELPCYCPGCDEPAGQVTGGRGLRLTSIDVA